MLKALYVIAIGLLFAGLVGFGFSAFYPQPEYPVYPRELSVKDPNHLTDEEKQQQLQYEKMSEETTKKMDKYNINLSIGLIIASLIILGVSILGVGKIDIIGDGVTLGGVFTLFYGLGRAMAGGDNITRFIAVAVGLIVLLFLTYWKFIRHNQVVQSQL